MIAFGCATTDERAFRAGGARAIEAIDEGDSLLLRRHRYDSIDVPLNDMMATAASLHELEALVLVHQDAVLETPGGLLESIRDLFGADRSVAVIWGAEPSSARGEGEEPTATLLALSPWAVRNLRFDPDMGGSADASAHDVALQARAAGYRALALPLAVSRSSAPQEPLLRRRELEARVELRRKWASGASRF